MYKWGVIVWVWTVNMCKNIFHSIILYSLWLCVYILKWKQCERNEQINKTNNNVRKMWCVLCAEFFFSKNVTTSSVAHCREHKSIQCLQQTQHLCCMCFICIICSFLCTKMHSYVTETDLGGWYSYLRTKALHSANDRPPSSIKFTSYSIRASYMYSAFMWHSIIFSFLIFQNFAFSSILSFQSFQQSASLTNTHCEHSEPLELLLLLLFAVVMCALFQLTG